MKLHIRRRAKMYAAIWTICLLAAGCGKTGSTRSDTAGPSKGPWKIALLAQGPTNGWATQFDAVARKVAKQDQNIKELLYYDASGNADKQVTQFENAVSQRPDGIVLVPMGKAALAGPAARAESQGIPVVLCASGVNGDRYHTLVTRDVPKAAGENAEWLAQTLHGRGNIVIVDGIAGNDTSESMGGAIRGVLKKNPGIKVIGQGYADFSVSKAKALTETFIGSGKRIDGAFGAGGESVTGIMQAFADAGKPIPPVAGAAATNGALRLAKEHNAKFAMFQFPATMSKACLDTMVRTLKGEKLPKFIDANQLVPNLDNFTHEQLDKYYRPEYADDFQTGSDLVLTKQDLTALKLVR
jgi:ribose transport system substrate-binding protein